MTWWFCANRDDATKAVWIDSERWFDARAEAWKMLGENIWVSTPRTVPARPPRNAYGDKKVFRIFWTGSAANFNDLRRVIEPVINHSLFCEGCKKKIHISELEKTGGQNGHLIMKDGPDGIVSITQCGPLVIMDAEKRPAAQKKAKRKS